MTDSSRVVDLFTGRPYEPHKKLQILRLSPEHDQLEMLYSNDSNPDKLYSMKILCWALRNDGSVVGLVPWLNEVTPCTELQDPLNGHWEGYYDPGIDSIFYEPPRHKVIELESSAEYYDYQCASPMDIIQEVPDMIGTHAVFTCNGFRSFTLIEVLSWRLHHDGTIHGMLVDEKKVNTTPVLPGDECLYASQLQPDFKYFFQHRIANKIKSRDPEALAAISMLIDS